MVADPTSKDVNIIDKKGRFGHNRLRTGMRNKPLGGYRDIPAVNAIWRAEENLANFFRYPKRYRLRDHRFPRQK